MMQKHALVLATSAFVLVCGALAAKAQQTGGPFNERLGQLQTIQQRQATDGQTAEDEGHDLGFGTMMGGRAGGMRGMMGCSMGQGAMGAPVMMRIIFALMDADGDGTIMAS
jgi:hypothetical protein